MHWALVLAVLTGPQHHEYVIDQFRDVNDCAVAASSIARIKYFETRVEVLCVPINKQQGRGK